jgi:hypothetical protein
MSEEENEELPGSPVQPLSAPFPPNHTTPAGQLLTWTAIRTLMKTLLDREHIKYIETYPQRYEEDRDELTLFERSEGPTSRAVDHDSPCRRMECVELPPSSPKQMAAYSVMT